MEKIIGTVGKWKGLELPKWWEEDYQKEYKNPHRTVFIESRCGDLCFDTGFNFRNPAPGFFEPMELIEALNAADAEGVIIFEGIGSSWLKD